MREVIIGLVQYIFEEKENRHLHVWILPRYDWMNEIVDDIIDDIGIIFDDAKANFRKNENYDEIKRISDIVSVEFQETVYGA